jgi:hypothetical protein
VARELQRTIASAGKQGGGGEAAGEYPHPNAKLLERLFVGGKRRNGGAASSRSLAMAAVEGLGMLAFSWAEAAAAAWGRGARARGLK